MPVTQGLYGEKANPFQYVYNSRLDETLNLRLYVYSVKHKSFRPPSLRPRALHFLHTLDVCTDTLSYLNHIKRAIVFVNLHIFYLMHDAHALDHFPENSVLSVEMRRSNARDEEL